MQKQDQNKSAKSNSGQMSKSAHLVQAIDISDFELIYSNLSSEGESINNFNEGLISNNEEPPSLFTQLTEEQRIQKLYRIISEINQEGIYKVVFYRSI